MNSRTALTALLILGLLISAYLVYVHYNPGALVCLHSGVINCASVITSEYSVILGVPLAVYSLLWFGISILLAYSKKARTATELWFLIGVGGIIYSLFSMYKLGEICIYCSALDAIIAISLVIFFNGAA